MTTDNNETQNTPESTNTDEKLYNKQDMETAITNRLRTTHQQLEEYKRLAEEQRQALEQYKNTQNMQGNNNNQQMYTQDDVLSKAQEIANQQRQQEEEARTRQGLIDMANGYLQKVANVAKENKEFNDLLVNNKHVSELHGIGIMHALKDGNDIGGISKVLANEDLSKELSAIDPSDRYSIQQFIIKHNLNSSPMNSSANVNVAKNINSLGSEGSTRDDFKSYARQAVLKRR